MKLTTKEIASVIGDNSNLPLLCMVDPCLCAYDEYCCAIADITDIYVDEYWVDSDNRVYLRKDSDEELIDEYLDGVYDDIGEERYQKYDDEHWNKVAEEWLSKLDWKPCIVAYIN